jgi:hypothetical protein
MDQDITLLQALEGFFASNPSQYYMLTDLKNHFTILRVDEIESEGINTEEFIIEIFESVEFEYVKGHYRFDFVANDRDYYIFPFDDGIVSI